jgi:hypothetical protein
MIRATVTEQKKEMETILSRLKEQELKIQRVSLKAQVKRAAPELVSK